MGYFFPFPFIRCDFFYTAWQNGLTLTDKYEYETEAWEITGESLVNITVKLCPNKRKNRQ
jgi:hypothetical protein